MTRCYKRSRIYFWGLFVCAIALGSLALLLCRPEGTGAQTVSTPIPRHLVLYWARRYTTHQWYWNGWRTSVPYALGYADWITSALGQGAANCNPGDSGASLFQTRLDNNCYWGCDTQAGADCSGYVMRVWGLPVGESKWDTSAIANHSTHINYTNRNEDLRIRMRMGDVFDDYTEPSRHVVLLHYIDNQTAPIGPRFYEETDVGQCAARWNGGGWVWLRDNGGWWNGTNGYRPYRHPEIRDDLYLPWLSHAWYMWETTLFARNNEDTRANYVIQHTIYNGGGTDTGALENQTYRRLGNGMANDLWELPTAGLQPGNNYRGGGVVAADTGDVGVVYLEGGHDDGYGNRVADCARIYVGVPPFSNLDLAAAPTLYMPVFFWSQSGSGNYYSKIFVQNAGSAATTVTAHYYGDDGRDCSHPVGTLQPWATMITHPEFCGWSGNPPASGSVRLTTSPLQPQPLAAITHETIDGPRVDGFNAFSGGSTPLYAPQLMRDYFGWWSTLHVQNASPDATTVTVRYYSPGGALLCSDQRAINGYRHEDVDLENDSCMCDEDYEDYTLFSAVISANRPLAAVVNSRNATAPYFMSYNVFNSGREVLVAPFVREGSHPSWEGNWAFSLTIQNTTNSANTVQVAFYDQAGNFVSASPSSCNLGPRGSCELYNVTTDPSFSGSALIWSDSEPGRSFAAVVGVVRADLHPGDVAASYSAQEYKRFNSLLGQPGIGDAAEQP